VIFDLFPAERLGVTLSDHYLMTPLKSTSFVIGLGVDMGVAAEGSPCDYCDLRERCKLRETRQIQGK
jgi:hypothetical protein